jgi:hypothetical protein
MSNELSDVEILSSLKVRHEFSCLFVVCQIRQESSSCSAKISVSFVTIQVAITLCLVLEHLVS